MAEQYSYGKAPKFPLTSQETTANSGAITQGGDYRLFYEGGSEGGISIVEVDGFVRTTRTRAGTLGLWHTTPTTLSTRTSSTSSV